MTLHLFEPSGEGGAEIWLHGAKIPQHHSGHDASFIVGAALTGAGSLVKGTGSLGLKGLKGVGSLASGGASLAGKGAKAVGGAALGAGGAVVGGIGAGASKLGGGVKNLFTGDAAGGDAAGGAPGGKAGLKPGSWWTDEKGQRWYQDDDGTWKLDVTEEAEQEVDDRNKAIAASAEEDRKLDDPASVLIEASAKARAAIERAQENLADAQVLHFRLRSQNASRRTQNLAKAIGDVMRHQYHDDLKARLLEVDKDLQVIKKCASSSSSPEEARRCQTLEKDALRALSDSTKAAAKAVKNIERIAMTARRRIFPLSDLWLAGLGPAPEQLDALDPPKPPGWEAPGEATPETSAGCICEEHSKCASRGREFTWCKVNRTEPCSLSSQLTMLDAARADHRVAGSGQPMALWDYCGPASPNSYTVHAGTRCAKRMDVVTKYYADKANWKSDGTFDWRRVPQRDRLTIEAMVAAKYDGQGLCVRTPSSGAHHICPVKLDLDAEGSGTEWARTRSWDFCVPRASDEKLKVVEELKTREAAKKQEDLEASGLPSGQEEAEAAKEASSIPDAKLPTAKSETTEKVLLPAPQTKESGFSTWNGAEVPMPLWTLAVYSLPERRIAELRNFL